MGLFGPSNRELELEDSLKALREMLAQEEAAKRETEAHAATLASAKREADAARDLAVEQRESALRRLNEAQERLTKRIVTDDDLMLLDDIANATHGVRCSNLHLAARHLLGKFRARGGEIQDLQRALQNKTDLLDKERNNKQLQNPLMPIIQRFCGPHTQTHLGTPDQWLNEAKNQIERSHRQTVADRDATIKDLKTRAERWDQLTELLALFMKGVADSVVEAATDDDDDDC